MSDALPEVEDHGSLSGMTAAVYGLGKMGLPLAAVLADNGATVWGVDIDSAVVEAVNEGASPVSEPGLDALLEAHGGDQLTATTDGAAAATAADVMFVLVPTIVDDDNTPDLSPVIAAGEAIRDGIEPGNLVVLESTVPPGTTAGPFTEAVEPDHLEAGVDFGVAHCPERTSAGQVIKDMTESYPKIVGATNQSATERAADIYETFNEPGVVKMPDATSAEAVKVFEGVYRDVNIALANELAMACEEWGLDAQAVFSAANTQPYCELHDPGIGVGGHCIPVYPHFVINEASNTPLLETARSVNDSMPDHATDTTLALLESQGVSSHDARVLVLGLTYRPGVHETRFAPALDAIEEFRARDVSVYAHDPLLSVEEIEATGAIAATDPFEKAWDAVVLATGHEEYRELDTNRLHETMRTPVLVDGRDFFDAAELDGFEYARLGDGTTSVQ